MSKSKDQLFMHEILGTTKQEIASYFGIPIHDFAALSVYQSKGGYLIVAFEAGKAKEYALYNLKGELLLSTVKTIQLEKEDMVDWLKKSLSDFEVKYGKNHADLGSGLYINGYFGTDGCIYALQVLGNIITDISRIRL